MADYDLDLEGSDSPVLGLLGTGARSVGLAGTGARTFGLDSDAGSLGVAASAFQVGLDADPSTTPVDPPDSFLVETAPDSGLWTQVGSVFTPVSPGIWTATNPSDFVGGPPLWEYVGS